MFRLLQPFKFCVALADQMQKQRFERVELLPVAFQLAAAHQLSNIAAPGDLARLDDGDVVAQPFDGFQHPIASTPAGKSTS